MKFKIIILAALMLIISIPFNVSAAENEIASTNKFASKSLANNAQRNAVNKYLKRDDLVIDFYNKSIIEKEIGEACDESFLEFDADKTRVSYFIFLSPLEILEKYKSIDEILKYADVIYNVPVYYEGLYLGFASITTKSNGSINENRTMIMEQISPIKYGDVVLSGKERTEYDQKSKNLRYEAIEDAISEYGLNLDKVEFYIVKNGLPYTLELLAEDENLYVIKMTDSPLYLHGNNEYNFTIYTVDEYIKILEAENARYEEEARTGIYTTGGSGGKKSGIEVIKDSIPYIAIGSSVLLLGLAGYFSVKKFKKSRR